MQARPKLPYLKKTRAFLLTIWFILFFILFLRDEGKIPLLKKIRKPAGSERAFSSHKCVGSRKTTRSCLFRNLYFDIRSKVFEYYVESTAELLPVSFDEGVARYDFSVQTVSQKRKGKDANKMGFLYLHAGGRRGKSRRDRKWYEPWIAQRRTEAPPSSSITHILDHPALLWESIAPNSFGHLLVDNIIPIFAITHMFEFEVKSIQIVLMASCEEHYSSYTDNITTAVATCNHLINTGGLMSPGLTRKGIKNMKDILHSAELAQKEKILFKKVVLGGGGLALWLQLQESNYHEKYADPGKRDSRGSGIYFRLIQRHYYAQFGIIEDIKIRESPQIVVLDKHGSRGGITNLGERKIANIDHVVNWIKEDFSTAKVLKINFQPMTWEAQLRVLAKTTIFISPRGSVSFRMLFLPKGAYAIVLSKPSDDASDANWESDAWFRYQSYFGILNYPVNNSELASNSTDFRVLVDSDVFLARGKIRNLIHQALKLQSQEIEE